MVIRLSFKQMETLWDSKVLSTNFVFNVILKSNNRQPTFILKLAHTVKFSSKTYFGNESRRNQMTITLSSNQKAR